MARQPPKCCCCVPLRPGLLAWAYIKLVVALTYTGAYVYTMRYEMRILADRVEYISRYRSPVVYILERVWPLGVCLLLLLFAIIFIIGVHRQNYKLLLVFLIYSLFEVMLAGAGVGWEVYDLVVYFSYYSHMYSHDPVLYLRLIFPVVVNILLPIYFIVVIKREVQRLKTARVETRAVLDIPVKKEQDETYKFVYTNETRDRREPLFPVEELERLRQQLGVKNV